MYCPNCGQGATNSDFESFAIWNFITDIVNHIVNHIGKSRFVVPKMFNLIDFFNDLLPWEFCKHDIYIPGVP